MKRKTKSPVSPLLPVLTPVLVPVLVMALVMVLILAPVLAMTACGDNEVGDAAGDASVNAEASVDAEAGDTDQEWFAYELPPPETDGAISVEKALENRRSHRQYQDIALSMEQVSQILWAAYGITEPMPGDDNTRGGLRTAPSAGAAYPLEVYLIAGNVDGIEPGVYRYVSEGHKIVRVVAGDVREELSEAALGQRMVKEAPAIIFYSAIFERTRQRYGERGNNYVYIELGHSAQNVYLQAEAMGLGTCAAGAFTESRVIEALKLPANEVPLYIMPIGVS